MQIKGTNHHVIPNDVGWCVIDEANQMVIQHFKSQEEAIEYAQKCARSSEGEVLIHTSPCADSQFISTVSLPQREYIPGKGHVDLESPKRRSEPDKGKPPTQTIEREDLTVFEDYYYDL
jgi:hypothetical protein